jgi:anthranilate synthase component 1
MSHHPDFAAFSKLAAAADYVPVYRRVLSDVLTPVSAFHRIDDGGAACLFESVIGGEKVGRYSFLAAEPFLLLAARDRKVTISTGAQEHHLDAENPLELLRDRVRALRVAKLAELPPFVGGAVGYAGYDTVRYVENLPNSPHDDRNLPDLSFAFYDHMIVFDNVQKTTIVVVLAKVRPAKADSTGALRGAYDDACRRVDRLVEKLGQPTDTLAPVDIEIGGGTHLDYKSNFTKSNFEQAVRKCVEYIRAGDIFQVVISQRLAVPLMVDPFEVYRTLRVVNPSP